MELIVEEHPLLDLGAIRATFPEPLGQLPSSPELLALLSLEASAPLEREDAIKGAVRDLFRHGGYKPTGRGKPASEYLIKAVGNGRLGTINRAVDACNVVSLHSGLPISVVDLGRTQGAIRIGLAPPETEYVFNPGGQTIKFAGLVCVSDELGPCANGVKDSQRTKTSDESTETLSLIWGTSELSGRTRATVAWYVELLREQGAEVEVVRAGAGV
jgi:DNA/RNA-binding domain of Phe-tRNA-synthetase-like protein